MEEKQLEIIKKDNKELLENLNSIEITTQEEYETAVDFTKKVKDSNRKVKEFWKPLKEQAAKTHKDIVQKEKDMLTPLEEAEKILKSKMVKYIEIEEKKAKEEETKIKKQQEELALEQLEEAEKLREIGDEVSATITEQNALAIDELGTKFKSSVKKVVGVSYKTDYEVKIIDENKVPSYINGVKIRDINVQAIKKIAQLSKGNIKIEGIEIIEKKISSIRI